MVFDDKSMGATKKVMVFDAAPMELYKKVMDFSDFVDVISHRT